MGVAAAHTAESTVAQLKHEGIELVRFLWVDHESIIRGKAVTVSALEARLLSGVGLAMTRQASALSDLAQPVSGFNAVGEVRLRPAPDTLVRLPHAPGSAALLCDLVTADGAPWAACPRTFLKEALDSAAEYDVLAGFEPEFTLCRTQPSPGRLEPADDSLCFDNEGFDATAEFTVELVRALQEQNLRVETCHPEFGPGQHEVTLQPEPALRAADAYVKQRMLTRGLARRRGLWATFAPVPIPGARGNGNHLHISLWSPPNDVSPATNLFADDNDALGLSVIARSFTAGLLRHLPGLLALTCASVNSYHRLKPGMWSGAFGSYGPDNREAAIRVPSRLRGQEAASTNIEFKACDSTANPYLALGALIHAGMDGVRNGWDPGPALTSDPNELSAKELVHAGVIPLPRSLDEALEALEADDLLMSVLGPTRSVLYSAVKRADIVDMKALGDQLEYHTHAMRY